MKGPAESQGLRVSEVVEIVRSVKYGLTRERKEIMVCGIHRA